MRAFITGSTGLLGSNLVNTLLQHGYEVTALARSREKAQTHLDPRVNIVVGDMTNVAAFAPQLAGHDVLFHAAAYFREYYTPGDHWAQMKAINVDATIELLRAAEQHGVERAIYVSSSTVIGVRPDGQPSDETVTATGGQIQNLYARSKVVAEEAIQVFLKTSQLPVVLILPGAIFGPRNTAPTSSGQLIIDLLNGDMDIVPPGGFSTVDARDVAEAMVSAVTRGRSGERYILSGSYYAIADIVTMIGRLTGRPMPTRRVPYAGALALAYVLEFIARFTGGEPRINVNSVRILGGRRTLTAAKAERELGFRARPFKETIRDEIAWYRDHGYLKSPVTEITFSPQASR